MGTWPRALYFGISSDGGRGSWMKIHSQPAWSRTQGIKDTLAIKVREAGELAHLGYEVTRDRGAGTPWVR